MKLLSVSAVLTLLTLTLSAGPPSSNPNLLVLTESASTSKTHSRLLSSLTSRGYILTTIQASRAKTEDLSFSAPGAADTDFRYGGIVLLCPTASTLSRKLSSESLGKFVDGGGSLFLAGGASHSPYVAKVAEAFGVAVDAPDARVIDHQGAVDGLDGGDRTFVRAGGRTDSNYLFGENGAEGDIVFRGPGASIFADNELVRSVIWGSASSYTGAPEEDVTSLPHESGTATVLGAALSTRIDSRFGFFGSFEALSDDVFDAAGRGHEDALTHFVAWTFGHAGVLRTRDLGYETARGGEGIRVKDEIVFGIDIEAWDGAGEVWEPLVADDVQVDFVMLNPWARAALVRGNSSRFTAQIRVPDQIGIFKFQIAYYRPGVSALDVQEVVPVRPFFHNEYRRFIPMAYPYYTACFSMIMCVFLLGLALNHGSAVSTVAKVDKRVDADSPIASWQGSGNGGDGRGGARGKKRN